MKAMLYHASRFGYGVESPSERLGGVGPERVNGSASLLVEECYVALFHVEEGDGEAQIGRFCHDAQRFAKKLGATRLVVAAFGHLSSNYAPMEIAIATSGLIVNKCREEWTGKGGEFHTSPFGHNKTLTLETKGHRDSIRFRSY